MQYRLLPLHLASLFPQHHYIWCSTGYFPYSWHHCTHNSSTSDAVLVTSPTVGITVPQQHYIWCSTGYIPYCWHHCTYNTTSSDAVPLLSSRYLRLQLTHCSLWFYCLISKHRVHVFFSQNELHANYALVLYLNIPAHATTGNNKLWTFPVPDSTHEIYKLQYISLTYQPKLQGLSSQTPLTRRDFESSPDRKILRNFSGRTWTISQIRGTLNMDV